MVVSVFENQLTKVESSVTVESENKYFDNIFSC